MPNESRVESRVGRFIHRARSAVAGAALAVGLLASSSASGDIIREGTGERRAALDVMELKPFDSGLWANLSEWTNGDALNATETDGKVVVVYTFSSFLPSSLRPIVALDRLQQRYADQGLIVVGVHHPEGFADAARQVERRRGSFRIAHDANGAFRDALRVDQDPDLYILDRAGRLRYADIETGSISAAVAELIEETSVSAASLLDRRAEARRSADQAARRSASLRSRVDLASLPEIPFVAPIEADYEAVDWPTFYEYEDRSRGRRGSGRDREEDSPRTVELPEEGNYKPFRPTETDGRMMMIYFWTPERGMAAWNEFYDEMQSFQREHPRDLVVVGVAVPIEQNNNRRRGSDADERDKEIEEAKERFNTFFERKPLNHTILDQIDGSGVLDRVVEGSGNRRGSRDGIPLPYVALVSSDGMLRWHGVYTWDQEDFRAAFPQILRNDPGVIARRAAEEAYISQQVAETLASEESGEGDG
ncbi:MAG: TlpA disulfide reductase family protein [Planctomycetota bacterium]